MSGRVLLVLGFLSALGCGRVDLNRGRAYACAWDAGDGQCPGGWRCGLSGFCHPDQPASYPCASDSDCSGWHCGVNHVCYDLQDAGAAPCASDLDCAAGWRCGLSGVCHDRSVGADYPCQLDSDCEQGWRCGPQAVCVDATLDGLRPATPPSSLAVSALSPPRFGPPPVFALSPLFSYAFTTAYSDGNCAYEGWAAAYSADGGITAEVNLTPSNTVSCGVAPEIYLSPVQLAALPSANLRSLAWVWPRLYALDDLGVWHVDWFDGGVTPLQRDSIDPLDGQLRALALYRGTYSGSLDALAFSDSGIEIIPADGGVVSASIVGLGSGTLTDVAAFGGTPVNPTSGLLAASTEGLFAAPMSGGGFLLADGGLSGSPTFQPLEVGGFTHSACSGVAPRWTVHRLRAPAPPLLPYPLSPFGGAPFVLAQVTENASPDAGDELLGIVQSAEDPTPCGAMGLTVVGPAQACPTGEQLRDFFVEQAGYGGLVPDGGYDPTTLSAVVVTRCGSAESAETFYRLAFNASPSSLSPAAYGGLSLDGLQLTPSSAVLWASGYVDELGRMIMCSPAYANCATTVMDAAPRSVLGAGSVGMAAVPYGGGDDPWSPGVGFGSFFPQGFAESPVDGLRLWGVGTYAPAGTQAVLRWTTTDATEVVGGLDNSGFDLDQVEPNVRGDRMHAVATSTIDGGAEIVVANYDGLWAGPLSGLDPGADAGDIAEVLVPLPYQPISGLTPVQIDSATSTDRLNGYLVQGEELFLLRQSSAGAWSADPVSLPKASPITVWNDHGRGRAAFADGTVFSLPSRLPLSGSTPWPVDDYATLCGTAYALADGGVYQLSPGAADGGGMGTWTPLDLGFTALPGGASAELGGARLVTTGEELILFTGRGVAYRIADPSCSP